MHKLKSRAQVDPAPLDMVRADVPEELAAIASRMVAKNPDERYFAPKEVAEALEAFLRTWRPDEATSRRQEHQVAGTCLVLTEGDQPRGCGMGLAVGGVGEGFS